MSRIFGLTVSIPCYEGRQRLYQRLYFGAVFAPPSTHKFDVRIRRKIYMGRARSYHAQTLTLIFNEKPEPLTLDAKIPAISAGVYRGRILQILS